MELHNIYIIGYPVLLIAMYVFTLIGNAVLGPESFREASSEGIESVIKVSIPLLIVLYIAYLYNLTLM